MPAMTTNPSGGKLIAAWAYITICTGAWWAFDAEGLRILDKLTAPAWDRSVSGVERPVFDPGAITTLASGHVAIIRVIAKTK